MAKESASDVGDAPLVSGSGSTLEKEMQPNLVFLYGKFVGQRIWQATVHGVTGIGHNLVTKPPW